MEEDILVTGIKESSMEKVFSLLQKENKSMGYGSMGKGLDGMITEYILLHKFNNNNLEC